MNVDSILNTLNRHGVDYLLIGGMNFLLRHKPILTFDVDIWIDDTAANRRRCEQALIDLDAEWGRTDQDWKPVREQPAGWLEWQPLFCLVSPSGAIDVFRWVAGLDNWKQSFANAYHGQTQANTAYFGLSDEDMLRCQYALDEGMRRRERMEILERAIREKADGNDQ